MKGKIYPCWWHAGYWSENQWNLHRQFVQGDYEQKNHAFIPASRGFFVGEVGAIGKVDIEVVL